jgi:hypothetical protein
VKGNGSRLWLGPFSRLVEEIPAAECSDGHQKDADSDEDSGHLVDVWPGCGNRWDECEQQHAEADSDCAADLRLAAYTASSEFFAAGFFGIWLVSLHADLDSVGFASSYTGVDFRNL